MNSERIKALTSFINKEDIVLDVGCDHGYLSIYLKQNNLCKEVYASDISKNALKQAQINFKKYHLNIKSFVSDGFNNINEEFNTAVIAGMGTSTILNILKNKKTPNKLIISSNNEHFKLRKNLNKLGYKLIKEKIVYEKNHYYIIMLYLKGKQSLSKKELLFGISNNKEYYNYLLNKNRELLNKVPLKKKLTILYENHLLKGLIEKK